MRELEKVKREISDAEKYTFACDTCHEPYTKKQAEELKYLCSCGKGAIKMIKREKPKSKPPTICPLLSIAAPENGGFTDCVKEKCWFYQRKMKLCAFVIVPMALVKLEARLAKGDLAKLLAEK